ncbi:MAG: M48 family metalloprotease [Thermodesulfobacteriota bacterium]
MGTSRVTMDFFQRQDQARKKTILLAACFAMAVLVTSLCLYLIAVFVRDIWSFFVQLFAEHGRIATPAGLWQRDLFLWVTTGTLGVILLGSLRRIRALSAGGVTVAFMFGGRLVEGDSGNLAEKTLVNVVEEMSIASGCPVPVVFVLDAEDGINAFAAGFTPSDAIIAVTRGCVERLTRDELQGVLAHEFSHILNGDMRLNLHAIGWVSGLLVVGLLGGRILRLPLGLGRDAPFGAAAYLLLLPMMTILMLLGIAVSAVGYTGTFFGALVKSTLSRNREFLADAAAVQFTRNPSGLAGALAKVRGLRRGSRIKNIHAAEASHIFFSNALRAPLFLSFSTHPPVEERLRRIDPAFKPLLEAQAETSVHDQPQAGPTERGRIHLSAEDLVSMVGSAQLRHLAHSATFLADLPKNVTEAAHEPLGARAVIYCLLLNKEDEARKVQLKRLEQEADPAVLAKARSLIPLIDPIDRADRLFLVDLTMASLRRMSRPHYRDFLNDLRRLAEADRRISLFEYTLQRVVQHRLGPVYQDAKPPAVKFTVVEDVLAECSQLLSILAWQGGKDRTEAEKSYDVGMEQLKPGRTVAILPREKCTLKLLDSALEAIAMASYPVKKMLLRGCVTCISADGWITLEEAELIRAMAASLDCPVPPLNPGMVKEEDYALMTSPEAKS